MWIFNKSSSLGSRLLLAAKNGEIDAVKTLVEQGAPVDHPSDEVKAHIKDSLCVFRRGLMVSVMCLWDVQAPKLTPLLWACMNGHVTVVEYLIQQGAKINYQDANVRVLIHFVFLLTVSR